MYINVLPRLYTSKSERILNSRIRKVSRSLKCMEDRVSSGRQRENAIEKIPWSDSPSLSLHTVLIKRNQPEACFYLPQFFSPRFEYITDL